MFSNSLPEFLNILRSISHETRVWSMADTVSLIPCDDAIHLSSVYRQPAETEVYRGRRSGYIRSTRLIANKLPLQRPLPVLSLLSWHGVVSRPSTSYFGYSSTCHIPRLKFRYAFCAMKCRYVSGEDAKVNPIHC